MRHLLQSTIWQEFQESLGNQCFRVDKADNALVVIERIRGGMTRGYLPYGPTINDTTALNYLDEVEHQARLRKLDMLRVEPSVIEDLESILIAKGYVRRVKSTQPDVTSIVDMRRVSADELLSRMNATNRNLWRKNVSLGESGVQFSVKTSDRTVSEFIKMMHLTSARTNAKFHSDEYFKKMASFFNDRQAGGIMTAELNGKPLASTLFLVDRDSRTLYYLHAGSYPEARKVNAGNLLVSNLIFYAKSLELHYVDLFGVAPEPADETHPLYGISRFKRAYGGTDHIYSGTWEISLSHKHHIIKKLLSLRGR